MSIRALSHSEADSPEARAEQLRSLREEIARRHAQWRETDARARCPTGVAEVDRLLSGGFPKGQVSVLRGAVGAGVSSLVARAVARATSEGERCAWVVGTEGLNAAALTELGVDLSRLWVVRSPAEEASWVATLLARSGGLALVAVDVPPRGWSTAEMHRLGDATRAGLAALVLVSRGHALGGAVRARLEASGRRSASGEAERQVRFWVERTRAGGESCAGLVGSAGRRPSWLPWRPLEGGALPSFVSGRRLHGRSRSRSREGGGRRP
jgi:hypothetical protein